jgi:hypothetical protein
MRRSVSRSFFDWSTKFEGYCDCMYLDKHKDAAGELDPLVTTGVGNLIDPASYAIPLLWRRRRDNALATQREIMDEWARVKNAKELALRPYPERRAITTLYLTRADVEVLVRRKLCEVDSVMRQAFKKYDVWPADAQLGILSMCWAMGSNFHVRFPRFSAHARSEPPVFATYGRNANGVLVLDGGCALECHMRDANADRNDATRACFEAAQKTLDEGRDAETLWSLAA